MRGTDFYSRSDKDLIIYYNRKATERDTTKISPTSSKKKKDPYLQKNNIAAYDFGHWSAWSQMSETCGKVMGFDYNSFSVYDAILIVSITDRTDGTDRTDETDRTDGTDI